MININKVATIKKSQIRLVLIFLVIIASISPFIWHLTRIIIAQKNYNLTEVKNELNWFELRGGVINNLSVIDDAELWLKLNEGQTNEIEARLLNKKGDRYVFWLLLTYLKKNEISEAENLLVKFDLEARRALSSALITLKTGITLETLNLLQGNYEWNELSKSEQTLRYLAIAQSEMTQGNKAMAEHSLAEAKLLQSNNPAVKMMDFNFALWTENWSLAEKIAQEINMAGYINAEFLTQMAVLEIKNREWPKVENITLTLEKKYDSKYLDYIYGIKALSLGNLNEGKIYLSRFLINNDNKFFKNDAKLAMIQIDNRIKSEISLQNIYTK